MGQRPRRERVGREAGVDESQSTHHSFVSEVGEELRELQGGEHPLVDNGPGRERREVNAVVLPVLVGHRHFVLSPLPDHVGDSVQG